MRCFPTLKSIKTVLACISDTKVVTQDALRTKGGEQKDFRDEALKTKVRTKTIGQDELKAMQVEQKDFRSETIKTKVKTKAYKEEEVKVRHPA